MEATQSARCRSPSTFTRTVNIRDTIAVYLGLSANKSIEVGPNSWKTVIVFEELRIPYTIQYLEFGGAKGGVEHPEFLKQNAAGRVPLIRDPNTGNCLRSNTRERNFMLNRSIGIVLTESNVIDQYLVDHYDNGKILTVDGGQNLYLVNKWLGFQASTQAPFYAQVRTCLCEWLQRIICIELILQTTRFFNYVVEATGMARFISRPLLKERCESLIANERASCTW